MVSLIYVNHSNKNYFASNFLLLLCYTLSNITNILLSVMQMHFVLSLTSPFCDTRYVCDDLNSNSAVITLFMVFSSTAADFRETVFTRFVPHFA
jgi:hypothetical protein